MTHPLQALFEAANEAENEEDDDTKTEIPPLKEAQAIELKDRFRRYHLAPAFQPGDLLVQKPGLEMLKFHPDTLFVFWRYLNPDENLADRYILKDICKSLLIPDPNSMIGTVWKGRVKYFVVDSRLFDPAPRHLREIDEPV